MSPTPSTSIANLRPDLAASFREWDNENDRLGFIAYRVLPVMEVSVQAGTFGRIELKELLTRKNDELARAPGAGYSRGSFKFTDDSFHCLEYGWEEVVDDRHSAMYANYFQAEQIAADRAMDHVLRLGESRVSDLVMNTTTWTGAPLTTAIGTPWSTYASATPLDDVEAAVQLFFDGSGLWPNALIMARKKFRDLRMCAQIADRFKAQDFVDVRVSAITEQMMSTIFDIDQIIVAGGAINTADEPGSSLAQVWPNDMVMVARVATSNDIQEPCIGRVFHWGADGSSIGGTVESYREETVRADVVRVRHDVQEKILYPQMGHLLTNA